MIVPSSTLTTPSITTELTIKFSSSHISMTFSPRSEVSLTSTSNDKPSDVSVTNVSESDLRTFVGEQSWNVNKTSIPS